MKLSDPRSMVTEHVSGARKTPAVEPGLIGLGDRGLRDLTSIRIFARVVEIQGEPAGPLHVTAPLTFGIGKLSPRLPEFLKRYPKVSLDLDLSIEKIDLFQQRIDVAVRIADNVDPGLVAIKLAPYGRAFC